MYVITGATGNTGSVIAQRLLHQGKQVRVIGRSADRLKALAAAGAEPFVCDITDAHELARAFAGAEGVYAMIPPDLAGKDYSSYQERVSDSLAAALTQARVPYVVTLSSVGADKPAGTGPVVGLHNLEQKINGLQAVNALHLRAAYFMENTLAQAPILQITGMLAGPLRPDLKIPMIATQDISDAATEVLLRLDFRGHHPRELLGQRDLSMSEVAQIIGQAVGKPALRYVQAPDTQVRAGMVQSGLSPAIADLLLEMSAALNSGHMRALEPRSELNTTPTSFETFVAQSFVPAYQSRRVAA